MYRIILASESPRRREIMETMGIAHEVMASNVAEVITETEPSKIVQEISALKVNHIANILKNYSGDKEEDIIIIGADTMVFYNGHALGKPKDKADAYRMLEMLSDHEHEVLTGVSIIIRKHNTDEAISFAVCTKVMVQPLSRKQIEDYIATGEPMDKAGAYGIQGKFGIHIRGIVGDYYNVMGFPVSEIYETLLKKEIDIKNL